MKFLSDQVRLFLVGCVFVFAILQLLQGIAHAKVYSPVDIQPYNEQSAKTISKGFEMITNLHDRMRQDTESANEAMKAFHANPNPQTKAEAYEKYGQSLRTQAENLRNMKDTFAKVEPELRKCASYLREIIRRVQENESYNRSPNMAKPYEERLKTVESILVKTDTLDGFFEKRLKAVKDNSVMFVQRGIVENTLKGAFPSPGKLFDNIGKGFEVLNEFNVLSIEFLSSDYSIFNKEDSDKGWERIQNAMESSN